MKSAENGYNYRPLQKRAMINFTKEACDWVREVKLQKYSELNYKNNFKIFDRRWFETTTLDKYASRMVPQTFYFALYSLHSFACF